VNDTPVDPEEFRSSGVQEFRRILNSGLA